MKKNLLKRVGLLMALPALASAQIASVVISDFEDGLDGWGLSVFSDLPGRSLEVDEGRLAYTPDFGSGFQWAVQLNNIHNLGAVLDQIGQGPRILLSYDVSFVTAEWETVGGDWVQPAAEVLFQPGDGAGNTLTRDAAITSDLITDTGNPDFPGGWSANLEWYPISYSTTITWDITEIALGASSSNGWGEIALAVNHSTDFSSGVYYFDNITLSAVPEPSTYAAFAGLGVLGFAFYRRRRAQGPSAATVA